MTTPSFNKGEIQRPKQRLQNLGRLGCVPRRPDQERARAALNRRA
jgi:hypothetical protein